MASRTISKVITFSLAITFCLSALPVRALAASAVVNEQVIKFYLEPALVPDMNFAKTVLPKYVADMNTILAKNTDRRLVFNPESGIILTSTKPQTDSASQPLPTEGFEIWAYAVQTSNVISYGGYAGMDRSGAGVLAGLKWTRLYDPDNLTATQVTDYTTQLDHMLHELAHVFGAGIGEYYNLNSITDSTGLEPLLNIRLTNPADSFWNDKPDFMVDPLLRFMSLSTRTDYLATVQYSNLTAAVINGSYRNGMPNFDHYTIQVLDQSGAPVVDANVKVWDVNGGSLNMSELLFDGFSDQNGLVNLPWGGISTTHTASNFLRLIKAYKDGTSIVQPRYFSIFDADSAMLVSQQSAITVTLVPPLPTVTTFLSAGKNDGWVLESAQGSQVGGPLNAKSSTFTLGDDAMNRQYRSILSFNTAALPENAVITKVTLKILKQSMNSADPFTTHGNLQVDMVRGSFGTKPALQKIDFQATATQSNIGAFTIQTEDGWFSFELNNQAYASINTLGVSQLRLQFEQTSNGDGIADAIKFYSGGAAANARPVLLVEYYIP